MHHMHPHTRCRTRTSRQHSAGPLKLWCTKECVLTVLLASISAFADSSALTIPRSPLELANINGVQPICKAGMTYCCNKRYNQERWAHQLLPWQEASCTLALLLALTFARAASSSFTASRLQLELAK